MARVPVRRPTVPHTDLRDRVSRCIPAEPLPLVHVTELGIGRNILMTGQLLARPCSVFGRELLYFFLGKPAYRLKDEEDSGRQISRYPCVFVVNPRSVRPCHVYPFDTGALSDGRYSNADPHLSIEDYKLDGTHDFALKQLAYAFENVDDYFAGRLRSDLDIGVPKFDQATLSFLKIANQAVRGVNDPNAYDDRASAIEVATENHVDLRGAVELVIMPQQYLEDAGVANVPLIARLEELGISTDLYDWQSTRSPADYRAEINEKVLAHSKRRGE